MRLLRRINYYLYRFQKVLIVALFGALLLLAFSQVVLRLFFRGGIESADSIVRYLVLWVGFLGASLATYKNRHINIDLVTQLVKNINRRVIAAVVAFAGLVICGFFFKASLTYILYVADTSKIIFIPKNILESVLPLAFLFMALRFLQNFLEALTGRRRFSYPEAKRKWPASGVKK